MTNPSILRRTYDTAALVALLNMVAVGGGLLWLVGTGTVDGEKVRRIAAVLRGQEQPAVEAADAEQSESAAKAKEPPAELPSVAASQMDTEIIRREADRVKEELRQRLALNNSILLRVSAERESFKNERDATRKQEQVAKVYRETEGFAKQIAIYNSLTPKTALQHLLGLDDPDEAARILLAMKTRQAKKIIEAAKRGDQRRQMMAVLQRLREVSPGRSAELIEE
ncbi:MAG: hypothetical protein ACYTFA_17895 [Planctomycetota bacterium]|jgi:hypothetical protein